MKKLFIGSLVGSIILFVWSFIAWGISPMHLRTYMCTPAQESILKVLAESGMETGMYAMPMVDNRNVHGMDSKYKEEWKKLMEEGKGKPMVIVS